VRWRKFCFRFRGKENRDLGEGKDLLKMIQISKLSKTGSIQHSEFIEIE